MWPRRVTANISWGTFDPSRRKNVFRIFVTMWGPPGEKSRIKQCHACTHAAISFLLRYIELSRLHPWRKFQIDWLVHPWDAEEVQHEHASVQSWIRVSGTGRYNPYLSQSNLVLLVNVEQYDKSFNFIQKHFRVLFLTSSVLYCILFTQGSSVLDLIHCAYYKGIETASLVIRPSLLIS